jgi:hypothetical protein
VFPVRYGQTYRAYLRWIMSRIVTVILMYHRHKPIDSINLFGSQRRRNVFPVRYRQTYRAYLRLIMSRIVIVILIYHRHKPIDSINLLDL